jgi:type VI secretion system secreted protein VgrG
MTDATGMSAHGASDSLGGSGIGERLARFEFATSPPLEHPVRVLRFSGRERLSTLYHFEVEVTGTDADFAVDDVLERPATLRVLHETHSREIHGVVVGVEHHGTRGHDVHTTFDVVPALWLLTQRHRSRIYQNLTTREIVDSVLAQNGLYRGRIDWRLLEPRGYATREYCVQYRESDYDFVARLLEDEGIFYFFDHPPNGPERLVFADSNQLEVIEESPEVAYEEDVGLHADREHIARFGMSAGSRPGSSELRDYDPLHPRQDLRASIAADREAAREYYDHPGGYVSRAEGRRRAQVRLEALRATRIAARGDGMCTRLVPGRIFALTGHPRVEFDRRYAIWEVQHEGHAPEMGTHEGGARIEPDRPRYQVAFECTPAEQPIRIVPSTPRPKIFGSQTAVVVGPSGEEIHVDEHGRIKVQFFWDREGRSNEQSSCWLRVAQSWAGAGWGGLVIPRIGMEVVIDFLEGDPDRPLVTGCVYNGVNAPPNPLPAEKTRSTFRTNSSPGGGGFNELTFEDAAGSEKVFLRAQKDLEEVVLHDHSTQVGHDQSLSVGDDRRKHIGHDETNSIGANRTTRVGANETLVIVANRERHVGANESVAVAANQTTGIGGNRGVQVVGSDALTVHGSQTVSVTGRRSVTVTGSQSTNMHASESRHVSAGRSTQVTRFDQEMVIGSKSAQVIGPYSIFALLSYDLAVVRTKFSVRPQSASLNAPKSITLKSGDTVAKLEPGKITLDTGKGASIVLDGDKVTITAKEVQVKGSAKVHVDGGVTEIIGSPVKIN